MTARPLWPLLLVALAACAEQDVSPQPRALEVRVFGETRPDAGALRAAVAWFTPEGYRVVSDAPVVDDRAALVLRGPPASLVPAFEPLEVLRFERTDGRTFLETYAMRPRLTIYDDTDRDGRLDPPPPMGLGRDRIVAVDRGSDDGVAWLPDVGGLLDVTPPNDLQAMYGFLGGALHAFVRVRGARELRAKAEWPPFILEFGDEAVSATLLACPRFGVFGISEGRHTILVDEALPASLICDPTCRDAAFQVRRPALDAPAESLPVAVTCLRDDTVAVYRATQTGWLCTGCVCAQYDHQQVLVADVEALPAWWPCGPHAGAEADYCEGDPRCGSTCAWRVCE